MAELNLLPVLGMNTISRADNLTRENGRFARDALNVDIHADGRVSMRQGWRKIHNMKVRDVWQSPLHRDVFAVSGNDLGLLDWVSGSLKILLNDVGESKVYYALLNNRVLVSCVRGLFVYDGVAMKPFTLETPPAPLLLPEQDGSLDNGVYGVAIAWLRGEVESGLSEMASIDAVQGAFSFTLPLCLDKTITGARVYMTHCNGGELLKAGDYSLNSGKIDVFRLPGLGRTAENQFMQPMPSGQFMQIWRGRLLVVKKNVLYFSQPLAFHWHDARHDFVQLPQRISFVVAVENGLWVGQTTGVVFLAGHDLAGMQIITTGAAKPVYGSAILLSFDAIGEMAGGLPCAVWLADNGYVIGTAQGQLMERNAGVLNGISGKNGYTVYADRRLISIV